MIVHGFTFKSARLLAFADRTLMVVAMKNQIATPPVCNKRYDLNADGAISVTDRTIVVPYIKATGSVACPSWYVSAPALSPGCSD